MATTFVTAMLVALATWQAEHTAEDVRSGLMFLFAIAAIFGSAGSYLAGRLIAEKIPIYFVAVALGTFVFAPMWGGGPNHRGALMLVSVIATTSLMASLATGVLFRRMLRQRLLVDSIESTARNRSNP
ncbi:MAG: hypothetical protein AAGA03_15665 [Planctomycetota bacterium]